jgi:hypothetical protein
VGAASPAGLASVLPASAIRASRPSASLAPVSPRPHPPLVLPTPRPMTSDPVLLVVGARTTWRLLAIWRLLVSPNHADSLDQITAVGELARRNRNPTWRRGKIDPHVGKMGMARKVRQASCLGSAQPREHEIVRRRVPQDLDRTRSVLRVNTGSLSKLASATVGYLGNSHCGTHVGLVVPRRPRGSGGTTASTWV